MRKPISTVFIFCALLAVFSAQFENTRGEENEPENKNTGKNINRDKSVEAVNAIQGSSNNGGGQDDGAKISEANPSTTNAANEGHKHGWNHKPNHHHGKHGRPRCNCCYKKHGCGYRPKHNRRNGWGPTTETTTTPTTATT